MNRYGMGVCALSFLLTLALPCCAQDGSPSNPWNGSWKADPASFKYDGPTVTITTTADGYITDREGTVTKVVCDGKPNPPTMGTVTSCTKTADGYLLENTRDGKPSSHVKVELSPDGSSMKRTAEIIPADGAPYTMTFTSKKVSGGMGRPTVWKEVAFSESQDSGILTITVKGDSIDFKETDNDKPITCKLDGTPVSIGARSMAVKLVDPHTLKVTYSSNGNLQRENTFVLSADGTSIQETDVSAPPSTSTMSLTLQKS